MICIRLSNALKKIATLIHQVARIVTDVPKKNGVEIREESG